MEVTCFVDCRNPIGNPGGTPIGLSTHMLGWIGCAFGNKRTAINYLGGHGANRKKNSFGGMQKECLIKKIPGEGPSKFCFLDFLCPPPDHGRALRSVFINLFPYN